MGGTAPTTAPTKVFKLVSGFMGVYTAAYSTIVPMDNASGNQPVGHNKPAEATARVRPRSHAATGPIAPRGMGLRSVRSILASRWASITWFSTLADAAANAVPVTVRRRVFQSKGWFSPRAAMAPVAVVQTTKMLRRAFDNSNAVRKRPFSDWGLV